MLRSLAAKAVVPVASAVTGFVIVCCLLLYSFIQGDLVDSAIQREVSLADTIIKSTHYSMLQDDRESLRNIITNIGRQEGIEHARIFNKKGVIMFSADPAELNREVDKQSQGCIECHAGSKPAKTLGTMEKARRFTNEQNQRVLAITSPIFNEPGCSAGSCHFHTPQETVLGTLDIGLSEEPLRASLATLRLRLVIFCVMVLLLTVGGVSALLQRKVLMPVKELVVFAETVGSGRTDVEPPSGSEEIETLGKAYLEQARRLERNRTELERLRGRRQAEAPKNKTAPAGEPHPVPAPEP